ncbi:hypothetical protein AAY473_008345 [Plecturocebus cupreus]
MQVARPEPTGRRGLLSAGFAHQFLDPGTYMFQDNGRPESLAVVLVKEEGVACGPGLSPVQPSSPYHFACARRSNLGFCSLSPAKCVSEMISPVHCLVFLSTI